MLQGVGRLGVGGGEVQGVLQRGEEEDRGGREMWEHLHLSPEIPRAED